MIRGRHDSKRRETIVILEDRNDCLQLVNNIVELMNHQDGKPIKLRIKTEAL